MYYYINRLQEVILLKTAIVTGASSGLGIEFIKALVSNGFDCIWLIARRKERLDKLAANFPDKCIVPLALDITSDEDIKKLEARLAKDKPGISMLVNNAGRGLLAEFVTADAITMAESVELNCKALTLMTRLVLPYMSRGSSIVNVSSIASFAPTARMSVYCATKAYVTSFSRALREELKPRGINVTAVCPGPMKTEFLPLAKIEKGASNAFDTLPYCNAKEVASGAIKAALNGRGVYTPTAFYKLYRLLAKLLPHSIVMKFSKT